jgi:hypothetical protein
MQSLHVDNRMTQGANPSPWLRPTPVAAIISTLALIHYVYMLAAPHELIICFVPDDAFYGLEVARHFVATGTWSFDRGFTTTTGFHLLNVYLMSLLPALLARPWLAIRVLMGFGVALATASIFLICHLAYRIFGAFALIPAFLLLTAASFTQQSGALMEYPFVVLFAALYVSTLFSKYDRGRVMAATMFVLGALGSLARSDFGGLPLAVVIACGVSYLLERRIDYLSRALWGLAGAIAGLGLITMHNVYFGGHLLSGSERAKALCGKRLGFTLSPPLMTALRALMTVTPHSLLIAGWSAILVGLCLLARVIALGAGALAGEFTGLGTAAPLPPPAIEVSAKDYTPPVFCTGLTAVIIYVLVYAADGAIQVWYTASFVIPLLLVLGTCFTGLQRRPILLVGASCIASLAAIQNTIYSYKPIWPNQRYVLEMARYLQAHPPNGRLAGWNVGIVGYFLDGKVTNLDGLMNDQIYPYMQDETVNQYLDLAGIKYIVDYPVQIEHPCFTNPLGYNGAALAERLTAVRTFRSRDRENFWLDYTLFVLQPADTRISRPRHVSFRFTLSSTQKNTCPH